MPSSATAAAGGQRRRQLARAAAEGAGAGGGFWPAPAACPRHRRACTGIAVPDRAWQVPELRPGRARLASLRRSAVPPPGSSSLSPGGCAAMNSASVFSSDRIASGRPFHRLVDPDGDRRFRLQRRFPSNLSARRGMPAGEVLVGIALGRCRRHPRWPRIRRRAVARLALVDDRDGVGESLPARRELAVVVGDAARFICQGPELKAPPP